MGIGLSSFAQASYGDDFGVAKEAVNALARKPCGRSGLREAPPDLRPEGATIAADKDSRGVRRWNGSQ
ncbi:MAG: hypothetical protein U1E28_03075 [Beijerinckiaceae bacterium]